MQDIQHNVSGLSAHLPKGQGYGRQRRVRIERMFQVVEAVDRNIVWYAQIPVQSRIDSAIGHQVAHGKKSGRRIREREQFQTLFITVHVMPVT